MDELRDALQAWMDAEKARQDFAGQYFSASWEDEPLPPAKVLDQAALTEFARLDEAVRQTREAYAAVARPAGCD